MKIPTEVLRALPKAELHCHLDGGLRLTTLLDLAKEQGVKLPADTVEGLVEKVFKPKYADLVEYLAGFQYTDAVMRNEPALERVAYEFAQDQHNVGVRYFEVRFAPQLHAVPGKLTIPQVLHAVNRGLERATKEQNSKTEIGEPEYAYGIICCCMRMFDETYSPYYKAFFQVHAAQNPHKVYGLASMALANHVVALRKAGLPIVALDIAGAEDGNPAADHHEAFAYANKHLIQKTVHAGEAYGAGSIYEALVDCYAQRIGHGFNIFNASKVTHIKDPSERQRYVDRLSQYVASNRICLEVCLTSNLQTIPELMGDVKKHPIKDMLEHKMAVTINTDNVTVSHTTIVKELDLAATKLELTAEQVKTIIINGFEKSFMPLPYAEKKNYIDRVIAYYDRIWEQFQLDGHASQGESKKPKLSK